MNVDDFVKEAAKQIRNKKLRAQFERELKNHILDRAEYYTDAGYDEETALEKAMEHMGEADTVGGQIGKVHETAGGKVLTALLIIAAVIYFLFLLLCFFFGGDGENSNLTFPVTLEFSTFLICQFAVIALCRKGKRFPLCCALFSVNVLYIALRFISKTYHSQFLLLIGMIFTGHAKDVPMLSCTFLKSDSVPLAAATIVMLALSVAAGIYALIKSRDIFYGTDRDARKKMNTVFRCFVAAAVCFTAVTAFARISLSRSAEICDLCSEMYFVESDEIVDFEELNCLRGGLELTNDYEIFEPGGPVGSCWWALEYDGSYRQTEYVDCPTGVKDIVYVRKRVVSEYAPSKRYIAVVVWNDTEQSVETYSKWFDTEQTDVLEGELDGGRYCELDYKITLTDDEQFIKAKEYYFKNRYEKFGYTE